MTLMMHRFVRIALATTFLGIGATNPRSAATETLQLLNLDSANLMKAKNRLQSSNPTVLPAFNKLIRDADRSLTSGTLSVVEKELTPPSGDKHDYMSIAPYWWPNPNTPQWSSLCPPRRRD